MSSSTWVVSVEVVIPAILLVVVRSAVEKGPVVVPESVRDSSAPFAAEIVMFTVEPSAALADSAQLPPTVVRFFHAVPSATCAGAAAGWVEVAESPPPPPHAATTDITKIAAQRCEAFDIFLSLLRMNTVPSRHSQNASTAKRIS